MEGIIVFQSLAMVFLIAVLGESGLGKVLDYKGNQEYFRTQFKNSPLSGIIGILFPVVTLMELATGGLALAGLVELWTKGTDHLGYWALCLGCFNFISLIFGQRMARDYAGASGVTPYLAVSLIGLFGFL